MNIGIVGTRTFNNFELFENYINNFISEKDYTINNIISGGAYGADKLAEIYAKKYGYKMIIHYPEWDKYGKSAGYIRNKLIINDSDIIIAFWDNKSKGTKLSIDLAKKYNKKFIIINI